MSESKKATVIREKTLRPDCTMGQWVSGTGRIFATTELPWRDDEPDVSCVPPGVYLVEWLYSPHHGKDLYHLTKMISGYDDAGAPIYAPLPDGRTVIELHSANIAILQLLGCMALGLAAAVFQKGEVISNDLPPLTKDYRGVIHSEQAMGEMEDDMKDEQGNHVPFILTIQ